MRGGQAGCSPSSPRPRSPGQGRSHHTQRTPHCCSPTPPDFPRHRHSSPARRAAVPAPRPTRLARLARHDPRSHGPVRTAARSSTAASGAGRATRPLTLTAFASSRAPKASAAARQTSIPHNARTSATESQQLSVPNGPPAGRRHPEVSPERLVSSAVSSSRSWPDCHRTISRGRPDFHPDIAPRWRDGRCVPHVRHSAALQLVGLMSR